MRKKFAIKPKNLKAKIDLCTQLRKLVKPTQLSFKGYGFTYYQAEYSICDMNIVVYYQRYVRTPNKVDYIKIYHKDNYKLLTTKERNIIKTYLDNLKK